MDRFTQDAERMAEVMERTGRRADIWQDRCVYWIAVAVYHLILTARGHEKRIKELEERDG